MFEHRSQPLLSRAAFLRRQAYFFLYSMLILGVSLGIGMLGYHYFSHLNGIDAFFNATMILTGMGPAAPMTTTGAKIFSGCYAMFSGVIFLTTVAVLFAPLIHRLLHRMHMDEEETA